MKKPFIVTIETASEWIRVPRTSYATRNDAHQFGWIFADMQGVLPVAIHVFPAIPARFSRQDVPATTCRKQFIAPIVSTGSRRAVRARQMALAVAGTIMAVWAAMHTTGHANGQDMRFSLMAWLNMAGQVHSYELDSGLTIEDCDAAVTAGVASIVLDDAGHTLDVTGVPITCEPDFSTMESR